MATLRVVLDTNVLLSGIAYPQSFSGKIAYAWRHGSIGVVLSTFILDQFRRVLPRLADRHQLTASEIDDLVDTLALQVDLIEPAPTAGELRDANDQPVLGTLVASGADYLITGDKDLLVVADRFAIVTPGMFWERHGGI